MQALKHILIQLPWSMSVRVRQGRALGGSIHSELLEPSLGAGQPLLDLTQRLRTPKLAEDHRHELRPRAQPLRSSVRPMPIHQLLELCPRNKLENLMENATESLHRRAPPCLELRQPDSTGTRRCFTSPSLQPFWTGVIEHSTFRLYNVPHAQTRSPPRRSPP